MDEVLLRAELARVTAERDEALTGRTSVTAHELLQRGGEWLGAARRWMQRKCLNGESVTWGSNDALDHLFTVSDVEQIAAEAAAMAMAPQPSEKRLGDTLKARWQAEQERDAARAELAKVTVERDEAVATIERMRPS